MYGRDAKIYKLARCKSVFYHLKDGKSKVCYSLERVWLFFFLKMRSGHVRIITENHAHHRREKSIFHQWKGLYNYGVLDFCLLFFIVAIVATISIPRMRWALQMSSHKPFFFLKCFHIWIKNFILTDVSNALTSLSIDGEEREKKRRFGLFIAWGIGVFLIIIWNRQHSIKKNYN